MSFPPISTGVRSYPCPKELLGERDLGWILWDMDYTNPEDIRPLFFRGTLRTGCWRCPPGQRGGAGMILQALTQYYETLVQAGVLAGPGWGRSRPPMHSLSPQTGRWSRLRPFRRSSSEGKDCARPQVLTLPAPVKRTVGIAANFLCDNSGYILGADNKGNPQRSLACFAACKALHTSVLGVSLPLRSGPAGLLPHLDPGYTLEHPALAEYREDILSGANLLFRYNGSYIHEDPEIRRAWERRYRADTDSPRGICLVTGEEGPVESVHPAIKNVSGPIQRRSSGLFQRPGLLLLRQGAEPQRPYRQIRRLRLQAALNYLLADREHVYHLGDATVVCWARGGGDAYQAFFGGALLGPTPYSAADLRGMTTAVSGIPVDFQEEKLDPNMDFYILGLSPNAARLSVRFFLHNTFRGFLEHIQAHYRRLEIVRPSYDKFETLPIWKLLDETVTQNARDKSPAPDLAGEVLRAVLNDTRYPATLLNGVALRIRAEREVTRGRAAILKAYYTKLAESTGREHPDIPEEVLQVSLNPDATNVSYLLGRLFSVLEAVQAAANPGINATIRDKYFSGASATPAAVFPVLVNLAQKHLKS